MAGSYTVNITDANGCSVSATYNINNDGSSIGISSAIISDEYCGSGSIEVLVSGGAGHIIILGQILELHLL